MRLVIDVPGFARHRYRDDTCRRRRLGRLQNGNFLDARRRLRNSAEAKPRKCAPFKLGFDFQKTVQPSWSLNSLHDMAVRQPRDYVLSRILFIDQRLAA
jgi:hypothetical protein